MIGDEIKLTILDVSGQQVKIGIDAPKDVTVLREEIYHKFVEPEALGSDPTESEA